ncbi:hypothetical protein VSS74_00760 [Conexibacter stalactiti]|uniref:WD40 repeat protein n=1 Tax=Conexibacter stalactiti TaxID=1940611 RepID=A0ABU4HHR5_9ACTN|nr:hypothetical protein [Conexibacter stalactiti]MDW5592847.1 hypothetical protein [Conexibacter stalactiti]MEC5033488.1 hypothetical protein [Conexibacter stalactiti]
MRRTAAAATLVAAGIVLITGGSASALRPGATAATGALDLLPGEIAAGESGVVDRAGSHGSSRPSVSADGRWVAFLSGVDALSGEAERDAANVFRKDRRTGRVVFVSRATGARGTPGSGSAWNPVISDDGRRIAWATAAALDPADTDGATDVYVRDLAAKTTTLATPGTVLDVDDEFGFSGDGDHVVFTTADGLVPGDVSGRRDVYRRQLSSGTTALVSLDAAGGEADTESRDPSISADGRWVAFVSAARDLVTGIGFGRERNPRAQVYARDMTATTDATTLVSHSYGLPLQTSVADARDPHITVDGGGDVHVAFASRSWDLHQLLPNPAAVEWHGYVRNLSQPETELLATGYGVLARGDTTVDGISADGRRVVFSSSMTSIGGPATNYWNIYVRDVASATTTVVTGGSGRADFERDGAISDDGAVVSWLVHESIVPDLDRPFQGVYARTLPAGPVELISRPRRAGALRTPALSVSTLGQTSRRISADGRYVALEVDGPTYRSVYRRDTWTGALEPAARLTGASGALATEGSYAASISDDGSRVVFVTGASLDPADPVAGRAAQSVYLRDFATATTTLVSRADGFGGANETGNITSARISGDGRHVVFPGSGLLVRDVDAGRTTLAGRADGPSGAAVGGIGDYAISDDGTVVAFDTNQAIDPDDPDSYRDVYVRDVVAETTRLVTRQSGATGAKGSGRAPALSGDGDVVAFLTSEDALAPEAGSFGGIEQAVARDLTTHQNTLVSRAPGGPPANAEVRTISVDADGAQVAFDSVATNLLPGHGGRYRSGVYVRATADGSLSAPPPFGPAGDALFGGGASLPSLSASGRCLAFVGIGDSGTQRAGVGDLPTAYVYALPATAPRTPRCRTQR